MIDQTRPTRKILKYLAAGLLLALCALPAPLRAAPPTTRSEAQSSGGLHGVLEFSAAPLLTMQPIAFRLTLKGPDGKNLTTANLTCDLVMPAMPMPENRPPLVPDGQGYRGEAVFTMAGAWQARVIVQPPSGPVETLVFPIERVLLK